MGTGNIAVREYSTFTCLLLWGNIQEYVQQSLHLLLQAYNKTVNTAVKYITLISDP